MADEEKTTGGTPAAADNQDKRLGAESTQTTPAANSAQTPAEQGADNQQDGDIRDPAAYYKAQAEKYQRLHEKTEGRVQELEKKVQSFDEQARAEVEKMLTDMKAEIDTAKAEAEKARLDAIRVKAAASHGLPADLAKRLAGDDEEAIMADAESLAKLIPRGKQPSPGNPAGNQSTLTMDEIKKFSKDDYKKRREEVLKFLDSQNK